MSFGGLKVLSLESRRAKEMETLIRREGGEPFVAPSVQERALDDHLGALDFIGRLEAGEFDLLVCMTGAGLSFLRDLAAADSATGSTLTRLPEGLRKTFIVSRGQAGAHSPRVRRGGSHCRARAEHLERSRGRRCFAPGTPHFSAGIWTPESRDDGGAGGPWRPGHSIRNLPVGSAGGCRAVARGGTASGGARNRCRSVYFVDPAGSSVSGRGGAWHRGRSPKLARSSCRSGFGRPYHDGFIGSCRSAGRHHPRPSQDGRPG